MKSTTLLLATLALSTMITGCNPATQSSIEPEMAKKLCRAILNNGLSPLCMPSDEHRTIGIMLDSNDDELARKLCLNVANKLKPMMVDFSGQWRLEVFAPLRSDKPLSYCVLR
jgi:hypothetical protein